MRAVFHKQSKKMNSSVHKKSETVHKVPAVSIGGKKKSSYGKKMKRYAKIGVKSVLLSPTFHGICKVTATTVIVIGMLYGAYIYIGKTFANEVVVSKSEIISRAGKLTSLPAESPYEIVRVQDQEDLRKQNPFYKDVKEGDYILMYKNMAIIYDLRNNVIVGIKQD